MTELKDWLNSINFTKENLIEEDPNLPCYLQDENGEVFEFKWDLIYQYISKLQDYEY